MNNYAVQIPLGELKLEWKTKNKSPFQRTLIFNGFEKILSKCNVVVYIYLKKLDLECWKNVAQC
jgi:hypothetical protein